MKNKQVVSVTSGRKNRRPPRGALSDEEPCNAERFELSDLRPRRFSTQQRDCRNYKKRIFILN
ncbi:MAG: hypothetical protein D3908_15805, partial [Candidatus Electrothrix sp. AUS4]|nr:hypothetical protein [Candidatus Electrothrix sp. AUS4]